LSNSNSGDRMERFCYRSLGFNYSNASVPHCLIRQALALFAVAWVSTGPAFAEMLRQGDKYDHDKEITVCLSSDDAKKFSQAFKGANVYTTGCFPAKLGHFSPLYRVDNIKMVTETEVYGFVYGISESVTPREGEILHRVPIYIVTSAVVVDQNQKEVRVADLD
jgi:hypothetical protein